MHGGMENRIRYLRKERGWSLRELAEKTNSSVSQIAALEKNDRRLSTMWMERLGKAFNVSPLEIISAESPDGVPTVRIVGYVGAGDQVNEYDNGDVLEEVPCPPGIAETGRGYCIRGDSNRPYIFNGWYVFTNRCFPGMIPDYMNELCIVKLSAESAQCPGGVFLKVVTKGTRPGLFNLVSQNPENETIRDVMIEESCIIDAMIPRRQYGKL